MTKNEHSKTSNSTTSLDIEACYQDYEELFKAYDKVRKILDDKKNWAGLNSRENWTGKKEELVTSFHQVIIIECLYLLSLYLNQSDDNNLITLAYIYRWVYDLLQNPEDVPPLETEQDWRSFINQANHLGNCQKGVFYTVLDFLTNPNPIIYLRFNKTIKSYEIIPGDCFDIFIEYIEWPNSNVSKRSKLRSYKAPPELPKVTKNGKKAGKFFYGQIETQDSDIVFEILEKRHLWLKNAAHDLGAEITSYEVNQFKAYKESINYKERLKLKKEEVKLKDIFSEEELQTLKKLRKKVLRRKFLLYKLKDFPQDSFQPLSNRYYSQPSGRIQPTWLHPGDISETAGNSILAGGVRQKIFCGCPKGSELTASDCNASAWQIVSLLFGDEQTQAIASGTQEKPGNFNSAMTEEALKGNYFVQEKIDTEEGRKEARKLVKTLLMTALYGSTANEQYRQAAKSGLHGYWREKSSKTKDDINSDNDKNLCNGAYRFLKDCQDKYPVLSYYVPLMQTLAEIASEQSLKEMSLAEGFSTSEHKYFSFKLPYIFEAEGWLNFDYPVMNTSTIKFTRTNTKKDRVFYSVTLQFPKSQTINDRFVEVDIKKIKKSLPPLVIHSIDSAIIKNLIILLDQKLPPGYGFATIHDCLIYPKDIITREEVQQLWNEAWRLTYKSFGRLLNYIIEIFKKDEQKSHPYLPLAISAYEKWQKNVQDERFLNSLWLSTSDEWGTEKDNEDEELT